MIRFSANLGFLWPDRPLLARIDAAAGAGFRAIELHWPYDVPAEAVRDRCDRHGLVLLGVNTARGDVATGENGLGALVGREAEFQAAVDQSIGFCRVAGGSMVHCMAGRVAPEARAAAQKVFVRNLQTASAKAAEHGLTLLLEPLNPKDAPGYFYSTVDQASAVLREANRPNIKLMFDAYHVGMMNEDVVDALQRHFASIGHVQFAAVPTRAEPDEPMLDLSKMIDVLGRLGYSGWIGAEYKPRGDTDAGLSWFARWSSENLRAEAPLSPP